MKKINKLLILFLAVIPNFLLGSDIDIQFKAVIDKRLFPSSITTDFTKKINGKMVYDAFSSLTLFTPDQFILIDGGSRIANNNTDIELPENLTFLFAAAPGANITTKDILQSLALEDGKGRFDINGKRFIFNLNEIDDKQMEDFYELVSRFLDTEASNFNLFLDNKLIKHTGRIFPVFLNKFKNRDKAPELKIEWLIAEPKETEETNDPFVAAASAPLELPFVSAEVVFDKTSDREIASHVEATDTSVAAAQPASPISNKFNILEMKVEALKNKLKKLIEEKEAEAFIDALKTSPDIVKLRILEQKISEELKKINGE